MKNLAKKDEDLPKKYDEQLAFMVWLYEKEFHIRVDNDFPVMKLYHANDKLMVKRYNELSKSDYEKGKTFR